MKRQLLAGAASGQGAVYAWEGQQECRLGPDGNPGKHRRHRRSSSSSIFFTPFEGHNTAEFTMLGRMAMPPI